jgi:transporter family protein
LTAIFAKIGIENINSDFATFIRTIIILCVLGAIIVATGEWQAPSEISGRTYLLPCYPAWLPGLHGFATFER